MWHGSSTPRALVVGDICVLSDARSRSCYETYSAAARGVEEDQPTDVTPSLAEQPAPPPKIVVTAVLDAERLTGIDPALLLTIAWTESRFQARHEESTSWQ